MIAEELAKYLPLEVLSITKPKEQVTTGLCTDLLSLVIGNSNRGTIWITHQGHVNTIAVALLAELSAVIIVGEVDENTVKAATEKGVNLFRSNEPAFEIVGKLYGLGITIGNE